MRHWKATLPAAAVLLLLMVPASAAPQDDVRVTGRIDIDLGDFDIVIGDSGNYYDGWDDRSTRVYVEVLDGYRRYEHYFDSLPAALFVLRELYGMPRIVSLGVPEYSGRRHISHGHNGHGLIDGTRAYYLWDYDRYSRGGLPLILAFDSYRDAARELDNRYGEIMDFDDVVWNLYRWAENDYDRVYWRGWDDDRWDNNTWDRVWDRRWDGWDWDDEQGWLRIDINYDDPDRNWRDRDHWDRNRGHSNRDGDKQRRDRGRKYYRDRDRDNDNDREDRTGSSEKYRRNDNDKDRDDGKGDKGSAEKHKRGKSGSDDKDKDGDKGGGKGNGRK